MSDLPAAVHINEEGPREGFQIEAASLPARTKQRANHERSAGSRAYQ
jgi:hypothetical protein